MKQATATRNADILITGGWILVVISRQGEQYYHPALTRLLLPVAGLLMLIIGANIFRRRCVSQAREIAELQRRVQANPDTGHAAEPPTP